MKLLNHSVVSAVNGTNGVNHHKKKKHQEVFVLPMTVAQARYLIGTDPDFIMSKRYGYSLKRLLEAHPEGCPARLAAAALMMTEEEVEACYQQVVVKLRNLMGVDDSL